MPPVMMTKRDADRRRCRASRSGGVVLTTLDCAEEIGVGDPEPQAHDDQRDEHAQFTSHAADFLRSRSHISGHQRGDPLLGEPSRGEHALDAAFVHDDHAVAHADDFFHVGADHEDGDALRRRASAMWR